ncbi:MAG: hypothetical protein IJ862_01015 [Selenomonadaceae bacterium]|nr:hypothetical protein [Selenomonadaceae bacterium]
MDRDIVILAISEKNGNYCVAGIDVDTGKWARPYSDLKDVYGAVPESHLICQNGRRAEVFDIVRIREEQPCYNPIQPENFFYDNDRKWRYIDKLTLHKTVLLHDFDYRNKIFFSRECRLTQEEINKVTIRESLLMLYITNLEVIVKIGSISGYKQFKLNFDCEGSHYSEFAISDIKIRQLYENKPIGKYKFCDKAIIVFSLTDKFIDGRYYKIAAQFLIWK